jgi:hypothetical protein
MFKSHSTLRSPKLAQKKKRLLWFKYFLLFFVACIILAVPPAVSHLSFFSIKSIEVSGNEVVTQEEIENYVIEKISGNYLGVFSKSNIFIYPESFLEESILKDFFRLNSVDISFSGLQSISVKVEERKPFAVWCASTIENKKVVFDKDCYFIDKDGFVFAQAPKFSGNVYVRYYGLIKPDDSSVSKQFFPAEEFKKVANFISQINKLGVHVTDAVLYEDTDVELYEVSGGKLLINIREDFTQTFENFQSLLNDKISVPDKDKFLQSIDYLDLRFGKKLFFKLR